MTNTALIIDSDVSFLRNILPLLESELKVRTCTATNGKEGIAVFDKKPVSFILLDLKLPDICGLSVLQKIRERCCRTNVFVVTGVSSEKHATACADLHVQGYLIKPVEPAVVIKKLKKIIGSSGESHFKDLFGAGYEAKLGSLSTQVKKALDYVHHNIDGNTQRGDIKRYANVSVDYLSRIFHRECGITFKDYVSFYRIHTSKELLLLRPDLKISIIAKSVGMPDVNYFSRFFRAQTGLSPTEFRKKALR